MSTMQSPAQMLICRWPPQDDNMMTREQLKQKYKSVQDLEDDFM